MFRYSFFFFFGFISIVEFLSSNFFQFYFSYKYLYIFLFQLTQMFFCFVLYSLVNACIIGGGGVFSLLDKFFCKKMVL